MKQVIQSLRSGKTSLIETPVPKVSPDTILIKTCKTLISSGTEKMLIDFGKSNLLKKAYKQPEKVKMVLNKIQTDGLQPTIETVFNKLDQPLPLGYCNVGKVIDIGSNIRNFSVGDRIVSNGNHAEFVTVPKNLCAKIPKNVSDEEAVFAILGSIALQGLRNTEPTLGESIVVSGLGILGLLTVQLLIANGCKVLGLDFDSNRLSLAREFGADVFNLSNSKNLVSFVDTFSDNRGIDAAIITAATSSNEPIMQAAEVCRKRGRITSVGVTSLELPRDLFYKKELTFKVSSSYGPGRYDINYEQKGQDYPIAYVRWTEQRNFEAILNLISKGSLNVKPLITKKFEIDDVDSAYKLLASDKPSLGIILNYNNHENHEDLIQLNSKEKQNSEDIYKDKINIKNKLNVAFIGAGNYASKILIPSFKLTNVEFNSIASKTGLSSSYLGRKFKFKEVTTSADRIINDKANDIIVIATRHDTHADFILRAISQNKHIFVEKPLCINSQELMKIKKQYSHSKLLIVGFNRRFSLLSIKLRELMKNKSSPSNSIYTINAGDVPLDHWTQDTLSSGGRLLGEACHFIDLLRFIHNSPIVKYDIKKMFSAKKDSFLIFLEFMNGSTGIINYITNGSRKFPKERIEIFSDGSVLVLDNFKSLKGYDWPGFKKKMLFMQDKGQKNCIKSFVNAIYNNEPSPIPIEEIFEVSQITIDLAY